MIFSATYYDGKSSRQHRVSIRVDEGQVLHVEGLEDVVTHPLAAVHIAPRLGDTVRSIAFP